VILFEDETGFSLHPKLGRMWAKRGSKPYVFTRSQHHKRLNLFGWVEPVHGLHGMMKALKGDTAGFIRLLKRILCRFTAKTIDLWVDNAKWHKGPRVREFLMRHRRLCIHYLPPYHPELNYQELLWRTMRYEETTNVYFETLTHLEVSVFRRSQRWKPQKIASLCKLI
jgi:transposase